MTPSQTPPTLVPLRLDWELLLALFAYAAASTADYLLTYVGLATGEIRELNPLLVGYIGHLGPHLGLLFPKVLLALLAVVPASLYLSAMHRDGRTRVKPQHLLYPGALFTVLAPAHWVLLQCWAAPAG
ncbi:MAG: DUF5658 family protein [Deferrisomatales bacterium]